MTIDDVVTSLVGFLPVSEVRLGHVPVGVTSLASSTIEFGKPKGAFGHLPVFQEGKGTTSGLSLAIGSSVLVAGIIVQGLLELCARDAPKYYLFLVPFSPNKVEHSGSRRCLGSYAIFCRS